MRRLQLSPNNTCTCLHDEEFGKSVAKGSGSACMFAVRHGGEVATFSDYDFDLRRHAYPSKRMCKNDTFMDLIWFCEPKSYSELSCLQDAFFKQLVCVRSVFDAARGEYQTPLGSEGGRVQGWESVC